ncbi:NtaA/DmoA family FMN-dependent monooxygenase [Bordetella genomosp. 13]|uniref:NtaA/DmoA family FMN-dependent monooxygenase n=1 Tax=Bordetella genomosp. 13 TaxID=463040 RepID=UPI00119FC093|nr:NtaA/DmoA family FMN-dependent monooxygenase [Bordetella genomosp. 13]
MPAKKRELHLGVNLHGAGGHAAAWRWPGTNPNAFYDIEHYVRAAKVAERGLLDAVFLADRPAIPWDLTRQPPTNGLEPTLVLATIARETSRIGLIGTASTTYNEPYNLARRFQSLDVISQGRAAWNAVTTSDSATVASFGGAEQGRAQRYDRAEAFVEVVLALWDSWDADSVIADQASGIFCDTGRLRPVRAANRHFDVTGVLTHPGSRQGRPVLVQAGGSAEGLDLAARNADAVFSAAGDLDTALHEGRRLRALAAQRGRAQAPLILPGLVTFIGGTEVDALQRKARIDALLDPENALRALAGRIQVPESKLKLDEPIAAELLPPFESLTASIGHHRTIDRLARAGLTVRQILASVQGGGHRVLAGSPEQIADDIAAWFDSGAVDGFNIMPDALEDGLPAFVEHVVPLLQRKGLFRTEYRADTLRGHLGLPLPQPAPELADTLG